MCDTLTIVQEDGVLFGKNSDRDANEAQVLEWHPATDYEADVTLKCTYIEIPQVRRTHATVLCRPFWMWGAEMGANDQGVVIGNEAVFTKQPTSDTGLTGMDLLRIALERAHNADAACAVITSLIERHGQGGGCGYEHRAFTYHNSFIIADPHKAIVLETAGNEWATEEIIGARSISNCLTIPEFDRAHSDSIKTGVASARDRVCRTQNLANSATDVSDLFNILRDHGVGNDHPKYSWVNGAMAAPCMHAGGLVAASQTTGSLVVHLRHDGNHQLWATGTSAPCTGLFKPITIDTPINVGNPGAEPDASLWWRHEKLHRQLMKDPAALLPIIKLERDATESEWLANPPTSQEAFAGGDALLKKWTAAVAEAKPRDNRPGYVRRYWKKRTIAT